MKCHFKYLLLAVALIALPLIGGPVYAKSVNPGGIYSEADLGAKPVATNNTASVGITGKVTSWVKNAWGRFVGASEPEPPAYTSKPVSAARKVASEPAANSVPNTNQPVKEVAVPSAVAPEKLDLPTVNPASLRHSPNGVAIYEIPNGSQIPRLNIGGETKIASGEYAVGGRAGEQLKKNPVQILDSPGGLAPLALKKILGYRPHPVKPALKLKEVIFHPKGVVSHEAFDQITLNQVVEPQLQLKKFTPFSDEEIRLLSGLLLYQEGHRCAVAVGLFHSLTGNPKFQAEADYFEAMCSKELGLTTDFLERARQVLASKDVYYSKKILPQIDPDLPSELVVSVGEALTKVAGIKEIVTFDKPQTAGNVAYMLADYGATIGNYKLVKTYATALPKEHDKYFQARFLLALAEYESGDKDKALKMQEELVKNLSPLNARQDFLALVHLNLARMYFQEKNFKAANENFLKISKEHQLWLQGLQEMGWAQLQFGDFEGAIGNMYSVQSPYFNNVYKPDSYVVRTIGYLDLCQYGDAYRTLTILEKQYRPWFEKMTDYLQMTDKTGFYKTVRSFVANKGSHDVDTLPSQVVREMVRHRDFLNWQNALNRQSDEREIYSLLDADIERSLKVAQSTVLGARGRIEVLRKKILAVQKGIIQSDQSVAQMKGALDQEFEILNNHFFEIDLFSEAKKMLGAYKREVVAGADKRLASMRSQIETILQTRLKKMRDDLALVLENNELLRYEVFARSGENIRYQVAGGEKGNRIPAHVLPKSKTLQWDFDGEYWEDEIGHYRSSLKNNCADQSVKRDQAQLDGGIQ